MDRRRFLACSAAGFCGVTFGAAFWRNAFAATAVAGENPYGPLRGPDDNGVRLPQGFKSRIVAVSGQPVPRTVFPWHPAPDGGACFPVADGGWAYVSNSEVPFLAGGVSMIRFDERAKIVDARRLLIGSEVNCAGGPAPWGTWLSCEEWQGGVVWECYLDGSPAAARPALGLFTHEAAAVDPLGGAVYLTEDRENGRFYRFIPDVPRNLASGRLEAAAVTWDTSGLGATVLWKPAPSGPLPPRSASEWDEETTIFDGGEGCWYDGGFVYFTTKGDNRVWSYEVATQRLEVIYNGDAMLRGVDNIVVSSFGDIYVAEDGGDMQLCVIWQPPTAPTRVVAPFLQVVGHDSSEITGPAFNPAGNRLYFSSQRGSTGNPLNGVTFEVRGPFRV
jgi:secreted PhoX family phosphatase